MNWEQRFVKNHPILTHLIEILILAVIKATVLYFLVRWFVYQLVYQILKAEGLF